MSLLRLIARLDIKGPNVVKGVRMEGLRVMGKPADLARKYAEDADELIYIDTVASLYGRNQLASLLDDTTREVFVPVTVGGGIKSLDDVRRLLVAGADKAAINTAAIGRPDLINEIAQVCGSQALCISIEAKRVRAGAWEAYTDNGRERTGRDAVAWAREAVERGAGELLITSVDQDGTMKGFDVPLVEEIAKHVRVPVIACGGMGTVDHLHEVLEAGATAAAMGSVLHYGKLTIKEMGNGLAERKFFDQRKGRGGRAESRCQS